MKKLIALLPALLLTGCIVDVRPVSETSPAPKPTPAVGTNGTDSDEAVDTVTAKPGNVDAVVAVPGGLSNVNVDVATVADSAGVISLERNMARLPGVVVTTSSDYAGWPKARLNDGNLKTSWFTAAGDAANLGKSPFIEMAFPQAVTVSGINLRGNREYASGYDILEGNLTIRTAGGNKTFTIMLPKPDNDFSLRFAFPVSGVTSLRFDITKDESADPGLSELEVDGTR